MERISCKLFLVALEHLPDAGHSIAAWCEGSSVTPERLADPRQTVSWDEVLFLLGRLRELCGSDEAFEAYVAEDYHYINSGVIIGAFASVVTTTQLYRLFVWAQRSFAATIYDSRLEMLGDRHLRLNMRIREGIRTTDTLWLCTKYVLSGLPGAIGLPPAAVQMTGTGQQRTFDVVLPPNKGFLSRLSRAWRNARGDNPLFEMIAVQQDELVRSFEEIAKFQEERLASLERLNEEMTRRQNAEKRLVHAQKMEVVSQLGGGVAHDFNNLLTVIQGSLELLAALPADDPRRSTLIADAMAAATGGAALTRKLQSVSRWNPSSPMVVDVGELVARCESLFLRTLPSNITLEVVRPSEPARCRLDPSELESALLNAVVNAHQAMPRGGRIRISTHGEAAEGRDERVVLTIEDEGVGMTEEVLGRAVEPFFTTKEAGTGTGLGLSMIAEMVREAGGEIRLTSEVGRGTRLELRLPRATGPAKDLLTPALEVPRGNGERILLVEDDPDVREVTGSLLDALGYEVVPVGDADSALEQLDEQTDLLFTDIMLVGSENGVSLAERAQERYPALKVLFCSGYAPEDVGEPGGLLVRKPFRMAQLARAVQTVLHP